MGSNYTIKQIADMAGVHRSTVDKVLHNRPGVSPEVRERIQKLIAEVDYKPNLLGKALKQQDKHLRIAVLLINTYSQKSITKGIEQARQEFGRYGISIEIHQTSFWDVKTQSDTIYRLVDEGVDALVIQPMNRHEVIEAVDYAAANRVPVITANSDLPTSKRICYVGQNHEMAARTAARMTAEMMHGKGRLAIVSGLYDLLYVVAERSIVFRRHLAQIAPEIQIVGEIRSKDDEAFIMNDVAEFLQESPVDYIYQTSGGVEWTDRAMKIVGADTKIVCFDTYPEHLRLVREGVVSCTIGQELVRQGYLPIRIFFDYFYYNELPDTEFCYTDVDIRVLENIDIVGSNSKYS